VDSGRQQREAGLGAASPGRDRDQGLEQGLGIGLDGPQAPAPLADRVDQFGHQPQHDLAVLEHVGNARRGARIVLQHEEFGRAGPHKIDPRDIFFELGRRKVIAGQEDYSAPFCQYTFF